LDFQVFSERQDTMTTDTSVYFNQVELVDDNPETRCPLALLLDISGSMEGKPIEALNEGLVKLTKFLAEDPIVRNRVELAVITFGGKVINRTGFQRVEDFKPVAYEADGGTPMGEAILTGLKLIEDRKEMYKAQGTEYFRPVMLAITDGKPTDEGKFAEAVNALREAETKQKVDFYAVGVLGADMSLLKNMQTVNPPIYLKGVEFTTMFRNLGHSFSQAPSNDGQIPIALQ
jgi:uncharacterized protein YegL